MIDYSRTPVVYRVTINMDKDTCKASWHDQAADDDVDFAIKGAVNPYEWTDFHVPPTTEQNAQGIAQGMLRWCSIINEMQKTGAFMHNDDWVDAEGMTTIDEQPTVVTFDLRYPTTPDPKTVYLAYFTAVNKGSKLGFDGNEITTSEMAIRNAVTAGICKGSSHGWLTSYRVFDSKSHSDKTKEFILKQPDTPENIIQDVTVVLVTDGSTTHQAPGQGV
jgi:hypothetical protein